MIQIRNVEMIKQGGRVGGLKTQLAMTQLSFNLGQLSKEVQKLEHAKLDTWGLTREIFCLCMNLHETESIWK